MPIIKNIDEVRDFFPASVTVDINLIKPYFSDVVDKYIVKYLSIEQYTLIQEWYNDNKIPDDDNLEKLLPYVQRAIVRFAIFTACDQIDLKLTKSNSYTYSSN